MHNVRGHGLRRSRYSGLARAHVQHVLTAMACDVARIADWATPHPGCSAESVELLDGWM
ncbi:hypothetical protein [Streptomyces sp. NPDC047043]|uniref:hypothetical protein n=1 Tax=Streptomyces sp. NPDC047043 TaxID=3154497 RepID=UPI0033CEDA97